MSLNHRNGTNLVNYYVSNPGYSGYCCRTSETRWWSSCYDREETVNYFIRFLAIPLVGFFILFLIFFLLRDLFATPQMHYITLILSFIGYLFIASFVREKRRARRFAITQGLIDVYDPSSPSFNFTLNNISTTHYTIGFVGDIMMMRDHDLHFHQEIIDFFRGVDLIVGNLEGIVSLTGGSNWWEPTQVHCTDILTQLGRLLTGDTQLLLCLSNNHSIDYGNIEFQNSLDRIRPHFLVYGRNDTSNVLVNGVNINIATATRWSNKNTWDCISRFYYVNENNGNGINPINVNNYFNILFPHWSYENERYVRPPVQNEARSLLTRANNSWDLIFGHHPHVRQAMVRMNDPNRDINKLVVFSGGNFTSGVRWLRASKHLYGIIMKCKIGPLVSNQNQLAIGDVEWMRTYNERSVVRNQPRKTIIRDNTVEPDPLRYAPYVAIILIAASIIINILERFFF